MKKRGMALLLGTALTIGLLSGCGTGTDTSPAPSETTKTEAASTADSQTEAAKTAGSGKREQVQLWHYFSASNQEVLEKMIKEFNESQDEVEVVPTYIARADLMKQYTMGALSGELPDIGMVDSPDMASFISMGVFEDITEELNAWGQLDAFYEGPMSSCTKDGRIYGLPQNTNCLALYYNIDLLEAAGLTEADVPTTWEELMEVARKTTTADQFGFAMSAKGTEEGTFTFIPWLYSAGADITTLDSEQAVHAMDFIATMVKEGVMSSEAVNWGQTDVRDAFIAGKAAMMQNGSWQIVTLDELAETSGFRYGCAYLPMDQKNATVLGGENFGICASANKEMAFKFFEFMMGKEGNAQFNIQAGKFPVRSDSMAMESVWTENEKYKVFSESMNFAVARGPHAEWPTISEGIYSALQAAILGEKEPQQAMEEAAVKAASVLD